MEGGKLGSSGKQAGLENAIGKVDQPTPAVTFGVHNSPAYAGQAYQRGDRMRIHRGAPLELSDFCFGSEMIERQPGNIGYLLAGVRAFAIEDLRDPGFCVARQFCRAAA